MKNVCTMEQLKAKALVVTEGMQVYFPQFNKKENLAVSRLQTHKMTYAYNNSVVAFVDEEGTFRVIPDLKGIQKLLTQSGYVKDYFYVPLSNWDVPVEHEKMWKALWEEKHSECK